VYDLLNHVVCFSILIFKFVTSCFRSNSRTSHASVILQDMVTFLMQGYAGSMLRVKIASQYSVDGPYVGQSIR
jgi:hypothetical protein